MSTPFICLSCRRLAGKARRAKRFQWDAKAGFISFNAPRPEQKEAASANRDNKRTSIQRSSGRGQIAKNFTPNGRQWPPKSDTRDNILESLFLTPGSEPRSGHYKGRYSAPMLKDRKDASGSDSSVLNASKSGQGKLQDNDMKPTERTNSFRRVHIALKSPIITFKKLRVRHGDGAQEIDESPIDSGFEGVGLLRNSDNKIQNSAAVAWILERLGRAMERKDFTRADALWNEALKLYPNSKGLAGNAEGTITAESMDVGEQIARPLKVQGTTSWIPTKLYNSFLYAFMTLRRSDKAINVWNHMVLSGRQPEQAAWGAMLNGCQRAKDPRSIEIIWEKMRAAGVKPDARSWTSRIGGLIHSGKWDAGIRALDEMGEIAKEAVRSAEFRNRTRHPRELSTLADDIAEIAKPNTATINVVLAGLTKTGKGDLCPRILAWAKDMGINLDIVTYNTLLRHAVRDGNPEKASKLLQQMEALNIQPDVVTFTIIIDGMFRDDALASSKQSTKERQEAVAAVLVQMERNGVQANLFSYGTIIDNLLKSSTPNPRAARAVLDHMAKRDIKPSPHIYTILLTYYFSQDPPDLAALDVLWNRIRLERGVVDHIFYDRMLEGYGSLGEFGKMMAFLRKMAKEGKAPGWTALIVALGALIQAGELDMASDLVSDVERENGLFYAGIRGQKGEDEFRQLVKNLRDQGSISPPSSIDGMQVEAQAPVAVA